MCAGLRGGVWKEMTTLQISGGMVVVIIGAPTRVAEAKGEIERMKRQKMLKNRIRIYSIQTI